MHWHTSSIEHSIEALTSGFEGLQENEANRRLSHHGHNEIIEGRQATAIGMFFAQFTDFMILVLIAAALISGIVGDLADSIVILVIVLLNAIIGFAQEYRAERAMQALKDMAAAHATVLRNGETFTVSASRLVPGDIVLLESGNIVPADCRVLESKQLMIDESSLTGESLSVVKQSDAIGDEQAPLADRNNMVFKGTFVNKGRGRAIVVATGMKTELGKIARMLAQDSEKTPLQKRLARFSKNLAYLILAICLAIFALGALRGEQVMLMLLTAISLAVAAIPESLPAVIAIALAFGAKKMSQQRALVRNLPAVETLGSVTYICSDKTGTLTQNRMTVEALFVNSQLRSPQELDSPEEDPTTQSLLQAMALSNDVYVQAQTQAQPMGDPTEIALVDLAEKHHYDKSKIEKSFPRIGEVPFDSVRKCMTTIHQTPDGPVAFSKGALEVLLEKLHPSQLEKDANLITKVRDAGETMAAQGLRTLAFAKRMLPKYPLDDSDSIERDLIFVGLVGMMDPPREEAKQSIDLCKQAGINPVMITGDHPTTARSIAHRLGILETGENAVLTGPALAQMPDSQLTQEVESIKVFARVSPEQKLRIVKALQNKGQFVAMTGDGVNDAPSLKRADIGVAMGTTGTDVSKEAAQLILLDDNFATIVAAVQQGRRIFDNIRKFIKYALTCNSAEIWTILCAPLFGMPIPLLPIHILWINLVTDGLPGLALAAEPAESDLMRRPPLNPKASIFSNGLGWHILWVGFLMGALTLLCQFIALADHKTHWQTMVFTVLAFAQMAHVVAIRSDSRSLFHHGFFANKALFGAVLLTFILQLIIIYTPALQIIFKTQALTLNELALSIGLASIVFVAVEIEKWIRSRRMRNQSLRPRTRS